MKTRNLDGASTEGQWDFSRSYTRAIIKDLETEVAVGIHPWERHPEKRQRVIVNVELFAHQNAPFSAKTVDGVLNYDRVREYLRSWPSKPHTDLLETLLEELVTACFADLKVEACRVSILKPDIFNEAAAAGVEVFRVRNA